MKKSRITAALLAFGISASMVFQTPVFATEETAVAVSSGITTNSISGWPQGPEITSASAVVMEDSSNTILYAKDMDTALSPAGAVKIMTCLLALENSQLTDQVTMTETGVSGVTDGGAHISSQLGEVFTMEQCLYAIMLASANDIALQVAEQIGGSVDAFVQKDMDLAHWVIKEDDVVDDLFNQFKQQLIKKINENVKNGEQATDMLMVAKYFERIGDHATNIAEWVIYSITGQHEN